MTKNKSLQIILLVSFQKQNYDTTYRCLSAFGQNFRLNPAMNVVPGMGKP